MIVSASPTMKPLRTGSDMKLARKPRRSSPASSAMIPVVATVRVVNAPVQGCASCATAAAESAAVAHIGPVTRWRELPSAA